MDIREHLVTLIDRYAAARNLSPSRVTTLVFNSGGMYQRLVDRREITIGRAENALRWFSANWPDGVAWPEGIARPPAPIADSEVA